MRRRSPLPPGPDSVTPCITMVLDTAVAFKYLLIELKANENDVFCLINGTDTLWKHGGGLIFSPKNLTDTFKLYGNPKAFNVVNNAGESGGFNKIYSLSPNCRSAKG